MPAAHRREFRHDVLRVVAARDPGVTIKMIAKDFGIHMGTLDKWLRGERAESGERLGITRVESRELRELRKHNRLLEQENEVLRRVAAYLSQANLSGRNFTRL